VRYQLDVLQMILSGNDNIATVRNEVVSFSDPEL
jgi:hypothetical protein